MALKKSCYTTVMNNNKLKETLTLIQRELEKMDTEVPVTQLFLNLIEEQSDYIDALKDEIRQLKTKINESMGEQGPLKVRKQTQPKDNDHSSEKDRKTSKKPRKPKKKRSGIRANKTVHLTIDQSDLPADAKKAGIRKTLIQDIQITSNNTMFYRQTYYSESDNKTYLAPLPKGYSGSYGPVIKAWTKALHSKGQMTIGSLIWLFNTAEIQISKASISRKILADAEELDQEKGDIIKAGFLSTSYQHLDDTTGREKGQNRYVNVLSNSWYSAYTTLAKKDRLSIIGLLSVEGIKFCINEQAFELMKTMKLPQRCLDALKPYECATHQLRQEIDANLAILFPNINQHKKYRKIILEATAIAAYRQSPYAIEQLIVDDAPQFKLIAKFLGLCWVHEGRHYKKLRPVFKKHKKIRDDFLNSFWIYYHRLKDYKTHPTSKMAKQLREEFDELFSQQTTGYDKLDTLIARTQAKSDSLLLVLTYPHIPLHNNDAELPARYQARVRDVHYHTMSIIGTMMKDALATIAATADKLSVNLFEYLLDRETKTYQMTSLAKLIKIKSKEFVFDG